jgi:hypothetical protein
MFLVPLKGSFGHLPLEPGGKSGRDPVGSRKAALPCAAFPLSSEPSAPVMEAAVHCRRKDGIEERSSVRGETPARASGGYRNSARTGAIRLLRNGMHPQEPKSRGADANAYSSPYKRPSKEGKLCGWVPVEAYGGSGDTCRLTQRCVRDGVSHLTYIGDNEKASLRFRVTPWTSPK